MHAVGNHVSDKQHVAEFERKVIRRRVHHAGDARPAVILVGGIGRVAEPVVPAQRPGRLRLWWHRHPWLRRLLLTLVTLLLVAVLGFIALWNLTPGVSDAKARVLGDKHRPTLALEVAVSDRAGVAALIGRIENEALAHVRQALENEHLPARLDIAVGGATPSRVQQ